MKRAILVSLLIAGCASAPSADQTRAGRQLDELYRPLLALVEESRLSYLEFKKKEGRQELLPTDRTLTDEEIAPQRSKIVEAVKSKLEGELRG